MPKTNFLSRRMICCWMVIILAAVIVVPTALTQGEKLLVGKWMANLSESQRATLQRYTLQFDYESKNVMSVTAVWVDAEGKEGSDSRGIHTDGKEYPVEDSDVVVVAKWVDSRKLEEVYKRGALEVGRTTYEVSRDGRTLKLTKIKDVKEAAQEMVFRRE